MMGWSARARKRGQVRKKRRVGMTRDETRFRRDETGREKMMEKKRDARNGTRKEIETNPNETI